MNVVTKAAATITPGVDDAESESGTFDVILSAQTLDRDGDELATDEWKTPLPEHITFDIDHGMSVATTVGSGQPFINDNGDLQVRGGYSSIARAQEVRTLVNEGHIRTTSVSFMTTKTAKANGGKVERELLNGAFVAVPSNREAVVLSSKSVEQKAGARNSAADAKSVQAIHDSAAALGANCDTADGEADGANKSVTSLVVNSKALANSVEDLQARICDELNENYCSSHADDYLWIQATFLNDAKSGTVVFNLNGDSLSVAFTDDGSQVTIDKSTETDVSIITTVVPEGDGAVEKSLNLPAETAVSEGVDALEESPNGSKSTDSTATVEKTAAAESADEEVALRARALFIEAQSQSL